jgi:hypothetical protein
MLYLCSTDHEEICHEGRTCPVCKLVEEISDLKRDLRSETDRADALQDEVDTLAADLEEAKKKLP